ncbi:MAG: hypothetical protein ACT4OP_01830 [Actinomycetota bacterium]
MKRHTLDPWSLVGGMFLTGLGLAFLLPFQPFGLAQDVRTIFGLVVPALVIVAGFALVAPSLRRRPEPETPPVTPEELAATEELPPSPLDTL